MRKYILFVLFQVFLFLLFFKPSSHLLAQEGEFKVSFQLLDYRNKMPVAGAEVVFVNQRDKGQIRKQSDSTGYVSVRLGRGENFSYHINHDEYFMLHEPYLHTHAMNIGVIHRTILLWKIHVGTTFRIADPGFEPGRAEVLESMHPKFKELVSMLKDNRNTKIELSCYTDSRGNSDFNLELSQKRAEAIRDYLAEQGIDPMRVVAKGYGDSQLVNHCKAGIKCSTKEHQANRRVEYMILDVW